MKGELRNTDITLETWEFKEVLYLYGSKGNNV
jgi:hypothetical protein